MSVLIYMTNEDRTIGIEPPVRIRCAACTPETGICSDHDELVSAYKRLARKAAGAVTLRDDIEIAPDTEG